MIKERAMELAAALRSGKYEQGKGQLKINGRYCCLGVACEISGLGKWEDLDARPGAEAYAIHPMDTDHRTLPFGVTARFGLNTNNGFYREQAIKIGDRKYTCLSEANDAGVTFAQIADYIEANWENL